MTDSLRIAPKGTGWTIGLTVAGGYVECWIRDNKRLIECNFYDGVGRNLAWTVQATTALSLAREWQRTGEPPVQVPERRVDPYHERALGQIAYNSSLSKRMLDALVRVWSAWPGRFWVSDVKEYDENRTQMFLNFEWGGVKWTRHMLDCCPEDHCDQALHAAISHFLGGDAAATKDPELLGEVV